jgi:VanZ family protein
MVAGVRAALFSSFRRMTPLIRYWLPLIAWMLVIFSASADVQSSERTSRFLEPFLRWIHPGISAEAIDVARLVVRKSAHAIEYAVLAWLLWRALWKPSRGDARPWSWKIAGATFLGVVFYAATDEIHQRFVPNRTGSVADACIDTAGGILGLAVAWVIYRRRAK